MLIFTVCHSSLNTLKSCNIKLYVTRNSCFHSINNSAPARIQEHNISWLVFSKLPRKKFSQKWLQNYDSEFILPNWYQKFKTSWLVAANFYLFENFKKIVKILNSLVGRLLVQNFTESFMIRPIDKENKSSLGKFWTYFVRVLANNAVIRIFSKPPEIMNIQGLLAVCPGLCLDIRKSKRVNLKNIRSVIAILGTAATEIVNSLNLSVRSSKKIDYQQ